MTLSLEVVEDPARAAAAMMVSAALGGGQIVLAGGSTPRTANKRFVDAVHAVGLDLVPHAELITRAELAERIRDGLAHHGMSGPEWDREITEVVAKLLPDD